MSMIRKPDVEVFRDSTSIRAVRTAHSVATASPKVVGRGIVKIYGSFILFVWLATGLAYIGNIQTIGAGVMYAVSMAIPAFLLAKLWRQPTPSGPQAIEARQGADFRGVFTPLPAHLRPAVKDDCFCIAYNKSALLNAAVPFAGGGFLLLFTGIFSIFGAYFLIRALFLVVASVDTRPALSYDGTVLTVHSLAGAGSIEIGDIRDFRVDTLDRGKLWSILTTGSRRVLRIVGHPGHELLIAYQLLGLEASDAELLVRKILPNGPGARGSASQQAFQKSAVHVPSPTPSRAASTRPDRPYIGDLAAPRDFDADAIMERYLADRDRIRGLAPQPAATRVQGFGRKVRS